MLVERKLDFLSERLHPNPFPGNLEANRDFARTQLDQILNVTRLNRSPFVNACLQVGGQYENEAIQVHRWSDFKSDITEIDNNSGTHMLRQAGVHAIAFQHDQSLKWMQAPSLTDVSFGAALVGGAAIHDIGEIEIGDIPYPIKALDKPKWERLETDAAFNMIDNADVEERQKPKMKEVYWKIFTSMGAEDIQKITGKTPETVFPEHYPWDKLSEQSDLYEKMGYGLTGTQQLMILKGQKPALSAEDYFYLTTLFDQGQSVIADAFRRNPTIPEAVTRLSLYRVSIFPIIAQSAMEGIPSAAQFISEAERVIKADSDALNLSMNLLDFSSHRRQNLRNVS